MARNLKDPANASARRPDRGDPRRDVPLSPSLWLSVAAVVAVVALLVVVAWRSGIFQPRRPQTYVARTYTTREEDGIVYSLRYAPQQRGDIAEELRGGKLDDEAEWFWVPRLKVTHPDGTVVEQGAFRPFPIVSGDPQTDEPDDLKDRKEGPWILRYPGGRRQAEYSMRGGRSDGEYTSWHENGYLEEKGTYDRGEKTGTWRRWHADGSLAAEQEYAEGRLVGLEKTWYRGDRPASQTEYAAGRRHGEHREWHENGRLKAEGQFRDDVREGLWRLYDEQGAITDERIYENGRPVQMEG